MIEFTENTVGIWFVPLPIDGDWMAHVARNDDGSFELTYRFRYYRDDKAFNSKDEKSWFKGTIKNESTQSMIAKLRNVIAEIPGIDTNDTHEFLAENYDSFDAFVEAFTNAPFSNARTYTTEEFEKEFGAPPGESVN